MARSKVQSGSKRIDENVAKNAAANLSVAAEVVTQSANSNSSRKTSEGQATMTDSHASVVPINLAEEIRHRAYELSENRGFASGHETEDWLQAEREVMQRYRKQTA